MSNNLYLDTLAHPGPDTKRGSTTAACMSLGQCARALGITRQAAHQIERVALYKLRVGMIEALREENPDLAARIERMMVRT